MVWDIDGVEREGLVVMLFFCLLGVVEELCRLVAVVCKGAVVGGLAWGVDLANVAVLRV